MLLGWRNMYCELTQSTRSITFKVKIQRNVVFIKDNDIYFDYYFFINGVRTFVKVILETLGQFEIFSMQNEKLLKCTFIES